MHDDRTADSGGCVLDLLSPFFFIKYNVSLTSMLQTTLDAVVIIATVLNSLSCPYRRATDVLTVLLHDGLVTFMVSGSQDDKAVFELIQRYSHSSVGRPRLLDMPLI